MYIGLVAHDTKKNLLQSFCIAYKWILAKHDLFATEATGRFIEEATGLTVHKYLSGHLGGQEQMCLQVENNEIDMVIYLRDTQTSLDSQSPLNNLISLCDSGNIPFATNIATAELLVKALDRGDLDWRKLYRD